MDYMGVVGLVGLSSHRCASLELNLFGCATARDMYKTCDSTFLSPL